MFFLGLENFSFFVFWFKYIKANTTFTTPDPSIPMPVHEKSCPNLRPPLPFLSVFSNQEYKVLRVNPRVLEIKSGKAEKI